MNRALRLRFARGTRSENRGEFRAKTACETGRDACVVGAFVVFRLDPVGGRVAIEEMREYLKTLRERKDRKPLFTSVPATALYPQNNK